VPLERAKRWVNAQDLGQLKDRAEAREIYDLFVSAAAKNTSARVDDAARRTIVSGRGDLLVHRADLRTK
jgi:hypothetical protein